MANSAATPGAPAVTANDLPDRDVIARVLGGDHAAFEVLVRRHNQPLFRAARAITQTDVDAEDVLQQAWLGVFKHLAQFRGEASFSTWAVRIAVNEAITLTRKRPLIAELPTNDTAAPPDAELARAQMGAMLESCLANIPQGNREVMVLRDVLELDTAETAACLGLSEEAVRVRLHRARAAIASAITNSSPSTRAISIASTARAATASPRGSCVTSSAQLQSRGHAKASGLVRFLVSRRRWRSSRCRLWWQGSLGQ